MKGKVGYDTVWTGFTISLVSCLGLPSLWYPVWVYRHPGVLSGFWMFVGTAILIPGALCSEMRTTCLQKRRTWKVMMAWMTYKTPSSPSSQLWRASAPGAAR